MSEIKDFQSRFGFPVTPFTRELRIADRFLTDQHQMVLRHLLRTVDDRMSASLVAPAGTGKTTLLRALVEALPEARYRRFYLKVNDLSKRDFCRELSSILGAGSAGNYPTLVRRLQERLSHVHHEEGMRSVLILDEAHDFRPDVLAILRILTNFEMDSRLVVSVILSGQAPLRQLLEQDCLKDVSDRLAHRATLAPLSIEDLEKYICHRCAITGVPESPFDNEAVRALFELSRGNMRACDRLALKALQIAHDMGSNQVNTNHVTAARGML